MLFSETGSLVTASSSGESGANSDHGECSCQPTSEGLDKPEASQDLVEALHIAVLHRMDVVAVEGSQRVNVGLGRTVCVHGTLSKPPTILLSTKLLAHEDG